MIKSKRPSRSYSVPPQSSQVIHNTAQITNPQHFKIGETYEIVDLVSGIINSVILRGINPKTGQIKVKYLSGDEVWMPLNMYGVIAYPDGFWESNWYIQRKS